jgi:site-specific DNA-methyltransferase (adenine-specific)
MPQPTLDSYLGTIHHGDCIAGMNALPAGSVDLVFADPPFNIGYDYDVYHDAKDYHEYLAWSRDWISAVHRVLKPDGTFWLAIGDEYAAELKLESQKLGFHIRSWVIWYYTFGVNCKTKFSRSHAHLFHFVKDPQHFTFRAEELENRIPSARLLVYDDIRGNPEGRLPDDTWILRPQDLAGHFGPDEDNWYFPRVAGTFKERAGFHGCQMPEQLLGRIVRICSYENDVVLDPFAGSATTLAVAKKLGRRHLGFDLSPDYVQRGTERLKGIRVGDLLDGATEPTMSAPKTAESKSTKRQKNRKQARTKLSPIQTILSNAAKAQEEWSKKRYDHALVEAFTTVADGYSVDRVIADPKLNALFANACRESDLPGDIRWWNRMLFRARKAGMLADTRTDRRTEISWEECDSFLFASEIAWKRMIDRGFRSLDDILCDPDAALEFDRIAGLLAPGFEPLKYRWGALKLRKESKRARTRANVLYEQLGSFVEPFRDSLPVIARNFIRLPETAGVYLVVNSDGGKPCYVGEALNLRVRLTRQFQGDQLRVWKREFARNLSVRYFTTEADIPLMLAYQSLCVRKRKPEWNLLEPSLK